MKGVMAKRLLITLPWVGDNDRRGFWPVTEFIMTCALITDVLSERNCWKVCYAFLLREQGFSKKKNNHLKYMYIKLVVCKLMDECNNILSAYIMYAKSSYWYLFCIMFFNPFPHNDTVWRPRETSFLKTLWEKETLLVTNNVSFSHSVFYPFG